MNKPTSSPLTGIGLRAIGVCLTNGVQQNYSLKNAAGQHAGMARNPAIIASGENHLCLAGRSRAIKKGSTANATLLTAADRYQPFGSMPNRSSSLRPNVLSQLARLIPAFEAANSNCAFNSGVMRTGKTGALPSEVCFLSRFAIDMYIPTELVFHLVGIYLSTVNTENETPLKGATNTSQGLTSNVMETNAMAKPQCTQTRPKFTWRFLALNRHDKNARPCRLSVEAETEREARSILSPHFILSFAARLPVQEVTHA